MDRVELNAWKRQVKQDQARQRAKALRYKRPALASLGWYTITSEIQDIIDACEEIRWIEDSSDVTHEVMYGDGCSKYSRSADRLERAANDLPEVFWIA